MTGKIMAIDGGRDSVVRIKGTKFVQMFQRFMKTLERLKGVEEGEQKPTARYEGEIVAPINSNDGNVSS
jgi:hypothetical protein